MDTKSKSIVIIALVLSMLIFIFIFIVPDKRVPVITKSLSLDTKNNKELLDEKLRQEIIQLELENADLQSNWKNLSIYATLITALVAVFGVIITIWKQINERKLDRQQREDESKRRLDEKFTSVISDLGSDNKAVQASSAVSIMSFLKDEYKDFHEQVFLILLANLKVSKDETINKLLINGFEKAIRIVIEKYKETQQPLDLSRINLVHANLSNIDLKGVDIAFANLQNANLTGSNLNRAKGIKSDLTKARLSRANLNEARFRKAIFSQAQFHDSNLVAADLKETDLRKAQFQQAQLQSAHFDKAILMGARFEKSNISDAFFYGASLDHQTVKNIFLAKNWHKAHFDDEIIDELEKLSKK